MIEIFIKALEATSLDEILLLLFIFTGLGFIKVLLFVGKNLKDTHDKETIEQRKLVESVVSRFEIVFEKLDVRFGRIEDKLEEINTTLTAELNNQDKRISLVEHDLRYVEKRAKNRDNAE